MEYCPMDERALRWELEGRAAECVEVRNEARSRTEESIGEMEYLDIVNEAERTRTFAHKMGNNGLHHGRYTDQTIRTDRG
jgi:hypothetical protein